MHLSDPTQSYSNVCSGPLLNCLISTHPARHIAIVLWCLRCWATNELPHHVFAAVKILCLEHGTEQVAIGTVYKDMKLKPTVLKEYTEDVTMAQQLAADSFCDDDDGLVLEDETARIKLTGAIDVSCMVTGIILAAKGVLDEKTGIFDVSEICFAGMFCFHTLHTALIQRTLGRL